MPMRLCVDCGASIADRSPNAKLCRVCAAHRDRISLPFVESIQGSGCLVCGWYIDGVEHGGCESYEIVEPDVEEKYRLAVLCPNCLKLVQHGVLKPFDLVTMAFYADKQRPTKQTRQDMQRIINKMRSE